MMIQAKFVEKYSYDAEAVEIIVIGKRTVLGTPDYNVLVSTNEFPQCVLEIYTNQDATCFSDIRVIDSVIFVGVGEKLHIYDAANKILTTYELMFYFGYFYSSQQDKLEMPNDSVLVASGANLCLASLNGKLLWESAQLGVDGVLVDRICNGVVEGAGDWDPPNGWEPFRVSLANGKAIR